jgi:hypothetical protein
MRRGSQGLLVTLLLLVKFVLFSVFVMVLALPNPRWTSALGSVVLGGTVTLVTAISLSLLFTAKFHSLQRVARVSVVAFDAGTLLVAFAASYYQLSGYPGEIDGVKTQLDALYFSSTVLTTVGFGDILAKGQFARALVTIQMLFDFSYLASIAALLLNSLSSAQEDRRS